MTAGRGIVHSEMPEQDHGLMQGFQLWINLPARDKMAAPRYQDIPPAQIPVVGLTTGVEAKVIAGELLGVRGPVDPPATEPVFFDLDMADGCEAELALPVAHNAFVYVYQGALGIGPDRLLSGMIGVLCLGDSLLLKAGDGGAKLLVVAGKPLGEPVAKYGPFVMNTEAELRQAVLDFQAGRF
jgi:redox-sensitive bicupin YhaK (pirin superfamily)